MTTDDVMQWLKTLGAPTGVEGWTMARLDRSKQRRVGVWDIAGRTGREVAVGGARKTRCKHVSVLVHWTQNAHDTELAAQDLYDAIAAADRPIIGGTAADYINIRMPAPVDVGADDGGVFERVIEFDIYHQ